MKFLFPLIVFLIPAYSFSSQDNIFTDADFQQKEFVNVSKDLSSGFIHTTHSGASSLGRVFGAEVGLVLGATESKNIEQTSRNLTGEENEDLRYLPYAGLFGAMTLPLGIGVEVNLVPKINFGDEGEFAKYSAGARWVLTDSIMPIGGVLSPLSISARVSYGFTDFIYVDNDGTSTETADFQISQFEYGVTVGFNLLIVEPYIGISNVQTNSRLDASTDYSSPTPGTVVMNRRFDADLEDERLLAGALLKFPLFRFGIEYSNLHSVERYTAKFSFKF